MASFLHFAEEPLDDELVARKLGKSFGYGIDKCQNLEPNAPWWLDQELED